MRNVFNPKVSIVIPVFNGGNFLGQAIDSALTQTYRNLEVLVINDGSDDGGETERIALSYGDRIRYYKKPNGGVATALNMAIDKMSGEFFSWLSHDDLYVKEKIERQIEMLSSMGFEDRARTIVYSDFYIFSNDSEKTTPRLMRGVPPEEFRYWLTKEGTLHGCTLLIPKVALVETGGFDERLHTTQDYDLWFRMAKKYRFVHLPERLVKARSHPEQGSSKMAGLAIAECNALLSGFVAELSDDELICSSRQVPAVAYAYIAASMWSRGFLNAGWSALCLSFKNFPQSSCHAKGLVLRIVTKGVVTYSIARPIRKFIFPGVRPAIRKLMPSSARLAIKKALIPKFEGAPNSDSLKNMELNKKFSEVYEKNIFGGGVSRSGEGSDLAQTVTIRRELPKLIQELGVKTFLDAPCGDWYWMRETSLSVEHYIGVDIVEAMIEKHNVNYGSPSRIFQCLNLASDSLPKADLIFSRDCLVHLSFEDALKIIANFKKSGAKYLLATTFMDRTKNNDLVGKDNFWRALNMRLAPFNFPEPLLVINEGCTEEEGQYADKSLGLWLLSDIKA